MGRQRDKTKHGSSITVGWLRTLDAAAYCSVSARTLRGWMKGGLKYVHISGIILIKKEWLDDFLTGSSVEKIEVLNFLTNKNIEPSSELIELKTQEILLNKNLRPFKKMISEKKREQKIKEILDDVRL